MDDGEFELARADRAVAGLMGIADLLDRNPHDSRIAAAVRSLALEVDESLGAIRIAVAGPPAPQLDATHDGGTAPSRRRVNNADPR